ncbi:hypothetical protein BU23DRAFT_642208 [Bimuria novae-zelandiae CBS 107.79]|uniref:Uncharacterized protein n=1 Tax=Bimuria novae-zelandiae CBS 107.79 TaxID=1447943 RepID=A0A6A5VQT0_9PLEO|nr:hypothetical protein BU23DRAFT_642208 [Bimuria novae-zelandiae CBS 107.79]
MYFFMDFSLEGNLPAGGKTTLQLITEDEVVLMKTPYAQWAKAPWSNTRSSLQSRLLEDRFFVRHYRNISCMRARLWEGMTPMSGGQWKSRKLDDTAN